MTSAALDLQPEVIESVEETLAPDGASPAKRKRWFGRLLLRLSFAWLIVFVVAAVVADWLPLEDPSRRVRDLDSRTAPFQNWPEFLGTDRQGRSVLSRIVFGTRVSLTVGVAAAAVAMVIGGLTGMIAGYRRGKADAFIGTVTDAALAFPPLVFLLALAAVRGPGWSTMVIGLTFVAAPTFARLSRANTLRFAQTEFVSAAKVLGLKDRRILAREILPNVLPPVAAYALLIVAVLITAEASLSFLGLGTQPPTASWGVMISDGRADLKDNTHLAFVPGIVLFITVFALNNVGDWLRGRVADVERPT